MDRKTSVRRWSKGQADRSLQPTAYLYAHRQLYGGEAALRTRMLGGVGADDWPS